MGVEYFTGLDLGQTQDFTALDVAERTTVPDPHARVKPSSNSRSDTCTAGPWAPRILRCLPT
jgi:hypothetical protein